MLSHFMEALRVDLADEGTDVSVIHPAFRGSRPSPTATTSPCLCASAPRPPPRRSLEGLERRRMDSLSLAASRWRCVPAGGFRVCLALGRWLARPTDMESAHECPFVSGPAPLSGSALP
ncbi:hypothetical protein DSL92_01045 [Billgrantia gudaonensis]|uniref:Uncharacterized protein n=1 Tax=Billgrantia gudaonensis TaxID=376427 RepID=A0A432JKR0_9GAMM|nr:hypothetical protein DSL92_01045 [Halomonas gudaonensis]